MSINLIKSLKGAALAALLFSASLANADVLKFSLTGDYNAEWQLNSTVKSDDYANGAAFVLYDVSGHFPGSLLDLADLYFYSASQDGGLEIYDYYNGVDLLLTDGPQLYTGPESKPTFLLGTFELTDFDGPGRYTLTVTNLDAPPTTSVPEPATGAVLLGGLGLMAAIRKRRQRR